MKSKSKDILGQHIIGKRVFKVVDMNEIIYMPYAFEGPGFRVFEKRADSWESIYIGQEEHIVSFLKDPNNPPYL